MADETERLATILGYEDPRKRYRDPAMELPNRGLEPLVLKPTAELHKYRRPADPMMAGVEDLAEEIGHKASMGDWKAAALAAAGLATTVVNPTGRAKGPQRKLDARGFYSHLDETLAGFSPKDTVTADTLAKRGVKRAEIEARGLSPLLEKGGAKVGDLQKVAAENPIQVRESFYAGKESEGEPYHVADRYRDSEGNEVRLYEDDKGRQFEMSYDKDAGNVSVQDLSTGKWLDIKAPLNKQQWGHGEAALHDFLTGEGVPKGALGPVSYADYSGSPDSKSYQERIVHLSPPKRLDAIEDRLYQINQDADLRNPRPTMGDAARARASELAAERDALIRERMALRRDNFKSGHFPEVDYNVGHYQRSLERDDGGSPVSVLWQIQSDPAQAVRTAQHDAYAQKLFGQRTYKMLNDEQRAEVSKAIAADGKNALTGMRDEAKIAELQQKYDAIWPEQAKLIEDARKRYLEIGGHTDDNIAYAKDIDSAYAMSNFLSLAAHALADRARANKSGELLAFKDIEDIRNFRRDIDFLENESNRIRGELRSAQDMPIKHPAIGTTEQWLTMTGRNAIKDALDSGAEGIALPGGHTVLGYNPGDERGMLGFYGDPAGAQSGIAGTVLSKELKRLDPSYPGVQSRKLMHPEQQDNPFHYFPFTDAVKASVKKGLPYFGVAGAALPTLAGLLEDGPTSEDY